MRDAIVIMLIVLVLIVIQSDQSNKKKATIDAFLELCHGPVQVNLVLSRWDNSFSLSCTTKHGPKHE